MTKCEGCGDTACVEPVHSIPVFKKGKRIGHIALDPVRAFCHPCKVQWEDIWLRKYKNGQLETLEPLGKFNIH